MPKRLERVTVATRRTTVIIPWESRQALLEELRSDDSNAGVVKALLDVGATSPVRLREIDRPRLLEVLQGWSHRVTLDGLPERIWELRNAIADDLHDDPRRATA